MHNPRPVPLAGRAGIVEQGCGLIQPGKQMARSNTTSLQARSKRPRQPAAPTPIAGACLPIERAAEALSEAVGRPRYAQHLYEAALYDDPPPRVSVHLMRAVAATIESETGNGLSVQLTPGVYDLALDDDVSRQEIARRSGRDVSIADGRGAVLIDGRDTRLRLHSVRRRRNDRADRVEGLPIDAQIVFIRVDFEAFVTRYVGTPALPGTAASGAIVQTPGAGDAGSDDVATRRAAWLKAEMQKRDNMTPWRLQQLGGPDAKTTRDILVGRKRHLTKKTRGKLVKTLSDSGQPVSDNEIPS